MYKEFKLYEPVVVANSGTELDGITGYIAGIYNPGFYIIIFDKPLPNRLAGVFPERYLERIH